MTRKLELVSVKKEGGGGGGGGKILPVPLQDKHKIRNIEEVAVRNNRSTIDLV